MAISVAFLVALGSSVATAQKPDSMSNPGAVTTDTTKPVAKVTPAVSTELQKVRSVDLPAEGERLTILGAAMVILLGFGLILEGIRRKSDQQKEENAK